jgi:predicted phage terminase large subunit-like protein
MTPTPRSSPSSSFDVLIDPSCSYPNVARRPLWMLDRPLDAETVEAINVYWSRARSAQTLAGYADYAILGEDMHPAQHHMVICEAIDRLLGDEYDDLIINTPPGAAKSTFTSHALGAYLMGRWPTRSVILATHTTDLSEKWSRKVRNTVASKEHCELFPDSSLSKDSTSVGRWATSAGGEFLAVGVGTSVLGFRADCAIVDDPIGSSEQAQSETQLAKVHTWYETDLLTRLKPGAKTVQICQRLAPNDLAGYVIARNEQQRTRRQRVLVLRMETEEGDEPDGTGRSPGDRLWPEWFTQAMVEDAKRDDYRWRTLYQQKPPSGSGEWVSREDLVTTDSPPKTTVRYLLSDLALSINKGDYSVHIVAGVTHEGQIVVEHAWRDRSAIEKTAKKHLDLVQEYKINESLIDDDNAAKVYVQLLGSMSREHGVPVMVRMMPMRGQDKETRAAPLRGLLRSRKVVFRKALWNAWLFKELVIFPNAMGDGVDDGVDALSLIGRRLISMGRSAAPTVPKVAPTVHQMTLDQLFEDMPQRVTARI